MGEPSSIAMCSPDVAARVLDVQYEYRDNLGRFRAGQAFYEVAGILNRDRGIISVSTRFHQAAIRFTGAHEIGHFLLHPGEVFHRDRPVSNDHAEKRPPREQEADYFAACFLASEKLVKQEFEPRFGRGPLHLTDTVAYHLRKERMQELLRAPTGSLEFAAAVAGARVFAGKGFMSLAERFGVSIPAMAIRLQELGLVGD
ncbi:ImmA/IrrE family metallo-endopeptidase [Burkholderia thailandensis]|uniref:ImmA/IrrE family metallo-endopeptidase n=1 Tax=Burkholderia thailandensis TaxID=57975 RepID=UPI00217DC5FD|nr:ImmA/IrrE family metallo-endopeptidase [Burkholderia thailandensis]MCS6473769.1 ImmA/IrrE family metallo-endopeptidase [Burkholderia thailandensis]